MDPAKEYPFLPSPTPATANLVSPPSGSIMFLGVCTVNVFPNATLHTHDQSPGAA